MMNLEQMKMENGYFEADGKTYVLLQEATADVRWNGDEIFAAYAICEQDEADEAGWQKAYKVTWEVIGDDEDASRNVNWDKPESIEECYEYNAAEERMA